MALGLAAHHHLLVLLQRRDEVDLARVRARVGARVGVGAGAGAEVGVWMAHPAHQVQLHQPAVASPLPGRGRNAQAHRRARHPSQAWRRRDEHLPLSFYPLPLSQRVASRRRRVEGISPWGDTYVRATRATGRCPKQSRGGAARPVLTAVGYHPGAGNFPLSVVVHAVHISLSHVNF